MFLRLIALERFFYVFVVYCLVDFRLEFKKASGFSNAHDTSLLKQ